MQFKTFYNQYRSEFIDTLQQLDEGTIKQIATLLDDARMQDKQIFILGNGGSATSATHWVCDFLKGTNHGDSKRFRMFSLVDNQAVFSALGNDFSFNDVFVEQLKNYLRPGDIVIGLSVSGNSQNAVQGLAYARSNQATTVSMIGDYQGKMADHSDIVLHIPSKNYGVVEDVHMYMAHVISQYIFELNKAASV